MLFLYYYPDCLKFFLKIQLVIICINEMRANKRNLDPLYLNHHLNEHQFNLWLQILHKICLLMRRMDLIIALKMNVSLLSYYNRKETSTLILILS